MSDEGTAPATARLAEGVLTFSSSDIEFIVLGFSIFIHTAGIEFFNEISSECQWECTSTLLCVIYYLHNN